MKGFPKEHLEGCVKQHTRKPYPAEAVTFLYSEGRQEAGVIGAGLYAYQKLTMRDGLGRSGGITNG